MCEIILLITMARTLAQKAQNKGRSKLWAGLSIAGWIGGELFGGCMGGLVGADTLALYALALGMAVVGALPGIVVVLLMPASDDVDVVTVSSASPHGATCPSCGSQQTERRGDTIECFACGETSD